MKILLLSPNGMLGRAWKELLEAEQITHDAIGRPDFDLTDPASIEAVIQPGYTHVVNCAAWTDVDGAEEQENEAAICNAASVRTVIGRVSSISARLLHYSTDYVFNGIGNAPYPVGTPRDPINAYGRTKAAGEEALEQSGADHLTIRTSWVYAPWGKNFVLTIRKLAAERDELKVVDDQRGRPTSAQHLAVASLALLRADARGFLHVCDGGECTWFELAQYIAEKTASGCQIKPCTTDAFPRPAKRPPYSVLDLAPTEALIGPMPHWKQNVDAVLEQL